MVPRVIVFLSILFVNILCTQVALSLCCSTVTGVVITGENYLTNGGFEAGGFSGWTLQGSNPWTDVTQSATSGRPGPHSGTYYAECGTVQGSGSTVSVSQAGNLDTAQTYSLSFWLARPFTLTPNMFSVVIEPAPVSLPAVVQPTGGPQLNPDSQNLNRLTIVDQAAPFGWTRYVLQFQPTDAATTIRFEFRDEQRWW